MGDIVRPKLRFSTICALALLPLSMQQARALPIVDQQADATGGGSSIAVISTQSLAQSFEVGVAGQLSQVDLMVSRSASTAGSFMLSIVPVSAGTPDTTNPLFTQAYSTSVLSSVGPFAYTFQAFDLGENAFSISAGEQLAIVLTSQDDFINWEATAPTAYLRGEAFILSPFFGPSWIGMFSNTGGADLGFRTLVTVPEPSAYALLSVGLLALWLRRRRH
jgi:hypothetical protein